MLEDREVAEVHFVGNCGTDRIGEGEPFSTRMEEPLEASASL